MRLSNLRERIYYENMFKLLNVFAVLLLFDIHLNHASKIDPVLLSKLEKGEKANVLVSFQKGVRSTLLDASKSVKSNDRSTRNSAIVQALQDNANTAQESVIGKLSARSGGGFQYFRKYWTSNRLFVKDADLATVKTIEEDPNVSAIKLETKMGIPKYEQINGRFDGDPVLFWNILHIQVPEAWEELGGKKGEGVIVANIDTGVRYTHENLKQSFRGEYGWLDGVNGTLEPFDYQGHGTGMMGILVADSVKIQLHGQDVYRPLGVAPGAKWMACRACGGHEQGKECSAEHILNCIQFMSCPTLPDGSNPDSSKAPHVLSFSISAGREGEGYDDDFLTMKNLGIIPVAGIGNAGAQCGNSESPGNSPWVIGVGSTDIKDVCWTKSAAGPSPNGTIKPDIVAPGVIIMTTSANIGGPEDDRLYISGGTSSATPHVAGVIALLHVRNPELTFEEAYQFITQNADTNITVDREQEHVCNESTEVIPNNLFGYGRISALKAVKAQTLALAAGK